MSGNACRGCGLKTMLICSRACGKPCGGTSRRSDLAKKISARSLLLPARAHTHQDRTDLCELSGLTNVRSRPHLPLLGRPRNAQDCPKSDIRPRIPPEARLCFPHAHQPLANSLSLAKPFVLSSCF